MPPHPKDKYNPTREEGSINAQAETRNVLQSLINLLAPYQPTRIMDAERGEILEVLAKPYGMGEVGATQPFQLIYFKDDDDNHKVRVKYSTLAGEVPDTPTPNDEGDWEFTFTAGNKIYGKITVDQTNGEVTGRSLHSGESVPANTDTALHVLIGIMFTTGSGDSLTRGTSNARYGPIDASLCRNWYAPVSPFYSVTFI
jgi:hypothetical protein